jgi:hypothetical protein
VKKLVIAATTAAFFIPGVVVAQDEQGQEPTATAPAAQQQQPPQEARATNRNNCGRLFTQRQFRRYASKVYWRKRITKRAGKRMSQMTRCQHSPKAERKMRALRKRLKAARIHRMRMARQAASLTPFGPCYGGRWAIPCHIVGCESGGSWSAYNPSGAAGPYQIMPGWGRPFPVRSAADRLAHHRIAARLYNGGAGASHWVCR